MKKQFFFSMLVAAALMVSCSSENVVAPENGGNEYGLIEGQPAFINVGLAMPGDNAQSRANDDLNDGDADEYAVKSGRLVLFKGSSEASATLVKDYNITDYITEWTLEEGNAQITTTSKRFVQEIESPNLSSSEKLYAYVILNDAGNATNINYGVGTTFADFSKNVMKAIGIADEAAGYGAMNKTNGFVMTSVPVATAPGNSSNPASGIVKTLTAIEASAVYPTKAQAEAADAQVACCYVERAAVKVEVKFEANITDPTGNGTIAPASVTWGLGNVNNNASGYYNTRQVDEAWLPYFNAQAGYKYRFVSGTRLFANGHEDGYRTYFGYDVNYDGRDGLIGGTMAAWPLENNGVTYTYENTFDENSQIYANTTYVGLKVVLNGGNTFYTIEGQNNTALDEASLKNKLAGKVDDQLATTINAIRTGIKNAIKADMDATSGTLAAAGVPAGADVSFSLAHNVTLGTKDAATGVVSYTDKLSLKDIKVNGTAATADQEAAIKALTIEGTTTIAAKLSENLTGYTAEQVNMYEGGVTYYATRIAHFGDVETPWNTEPASYNQYDKIYPMDGQALGVTPNNYGSSRANAWLGRWGIVRNNWYRINITAVQGIGDAVPVDYSDSSTGKPGSTPDDNPNPKYYIAAHIHILPWCLRTQNVIL